jgi:hypothetical protein
VSGSNCNQPVKVAQYVCGRTHLPPSDPITPNKIQGSQPGEICSRGGEIIGQNIVRIAIATTFP